MFLGPPRLYQELEELQHDLDVVEHVSHMVGTLQGTYQVPRQLGVSRSSGSEGSEFPLVHDKLIKSSPITSGMTFTFTFRSSNTREEEFHGRRVGSR